MASCCENCGAPLPEGSLFCAACGNAIPTQLSGESGAIVHASDAREVEAVATELREALAPGLLLVRALGQGGMGTVFLARDPALKRNVVVKVLSPALAVDEGARRRFAREAEAAAAVAHPHVVSVFQVGELPRSGTAYFVMQYVEGQSLEAACPVGTQVPVARVKRIVGEIASALAAAHARGLVHRDIKPANVMLEAESDRVVVLDFGISAAVSPERQVQTGTKLTQQGMSIGTPQYMSPEQAAGDAVTDRSDVYSLGLVAFELLTGRAVFDERTPMALIAAHIHREPPKVDALRPDLEPTLADLVDRCLLKDPEKRPAAADIARMLVPPAQPRIEWPPPGLEAVHGRGWYLAKVATWTAAAVAAVFFLVYEQPAIASGAWMRGETSWFWRTLWAPQLFFDHTFMHVIECAARGESGRACPPVPVDAQPVWLFAIAALCAAGVLGFVLTVRGAWGVWRLLRAGAQSGYPWSVLRDAAWDAGPETVDLLNGRGAYVLLGGPERDDLRRRRGLALRWLLGGSVLTALMPLLWFVGIAVVGDGRERAVTGAELLLVVAPLLAGAIGWAFVLRPEGRIRRRGRAGRRASRLVSVAPSLVHGWLAGAGDVALGRTSVLRTVSRLGGSLAVTASIVLVALPILLYALGSSIFFGPSIRRQFDNWIDFARSPGGDSWRSIDARLAQVIAGIPATTREVGRVARPGVVLDSVLFGPVLFPEVLTELVHDSAWAWLAEWRRALREVAARADPRTDTFPEIPRGTWEEMKRALPAVALAFASGDSVAGWQRLREALVVGRYLESHESASGVFYLRVALDLDARVALRRGDSATAAFVRELSASIGRHNWAHLGFYAFPAYTLMADPGMPPGEPFVHDTTLAPWVRRRLAEGAVGGMCLNGRELLFGMSPQRRALIARVRTAAPDVVSVERAVRVLVARHDTLARSRPGILGVGARLKWCGRARIFQYS